MDYLERAKRLVEVPLVNSWYEDQREKDQRFHEEQQEADVSTFTAVCVWPPYHIPVYMCSQ